MEDGMTARPADTAPTDPRELDYLYKEADRIYYGFARRCGLSTCAYWMMYDIERAGGAMALRSLTDSWAFSKQTINSSVRNLEKQGFIYLKQGIGREKNIFLRDMGRGLVE